MTTTITADDELERDHPHDNNGYLYHGCRGPRCRKAHALEIADSRAERRKYVEEFGLPEGVAHGASAYTNWGCRCDKCRAGHTEETKRYK